MAIEVSDQALHSAQSLFLKLKEAFPSYAADFDTKWQRWQQAISPTSDPSTWSSVAEFDALVALGPKAIPLVLWKLAMNLEDVTAIYLYNKLEKDTAYLVNDNHLTHQVSGVLEKNFKRNRLIRNALLDWAEHCDMVARQRSSAFYTECEEYEQLVKLGPSVIPQFMLRYKKKDGPLFGYELLHEILWGYQTEQESVNLDAQYKMWAEWFEKNNYDQAPHHARVPRRAGA
ncbi:hypothetical protein C7999DRAFT_40482 [Corynascus novoguineensis]|uniref:Uncharacterized protein n=1 Tax=Corynascus novoguineensis TaxID=1126955 RepID=A0AAN7HJV4_9PEZI|nr:hypothetical protein C7999DRAFT_40482 [Corynascus novoguineensis]